MSGKAGDQAQASGKRRRPGGRAAEVVEAVYAATIALLQERGYEGMEIPAIAERAAVNKTSIYRRWPSKIELVLEVALMRLRSDVPLPDTGTLQGDLTELLRNIAAVLATPFGSGLLRAIIGHEHEAGIQEARTRFFAERYSISVEILRKAIARGELPADTDSRLFMEMAVAPIFFRALVVGVAMTDDEVISAVKRVIAAFLCK